jgi:tetratricopeptide (TPR) repeat protein
MRYLLFLLLPFTAIAQVKEGDKAYNNLRFADAIYYYQQVMKKDSSQALMLKLANSYYKTQQYSKALPLYAKLNSPDVDTRFRYGQLLAMQGRYQDAAAQYRTCLQQGMKDDQISQTIALYEQGMPNNSDSAHIYLLNINSGYADFSPVFYGAGLVFVSDRPRGSAVKRTNGWNGGDFLSIYRINDTARVKDASLRTKELEQVLSYAPKDAHNNDNSRGTAGDNDIVSVNPQINYKGLPNQLSAAMVTLFDTRLTGRYHEGPVCFSKNFDTILITRNYPVKNQVSRLKLQMLTSKNDNWVELPAFPYNSNAYNVGQPALHPNGQVLYFTSDQPGGMGGKDIYYCLHTADGWSSPMNAGPNVNTAGDEMFPYISPDGKLYFSSDRWPGFGGLDIFSVMLDNTYKPATPPKNEGAPINSPNNDFGILLYPGASKGYFSSDRRGNDDIYLIVR